MFDSMNQYIKASLFTKRISEYIENVRLFDININFFNYTIVK